MEDMERYMMDLEKFKLSDNHFWNNKRVLITGHTGFKGSWLTLWLHSLVHQYVVFLKKKMMNLIYSSS